MKGLDDDINVATVTRDGTVRVYGHMNSENYRHYIRTEKFSNYGQGKLWADEYEDAQRADRPARAR